MFAQTHKAISVFEKKYPQCQGLFIFDHAKRPDDALNADQMNVRDGEKQPCMRDTEWNGIIQHMVNDDGTQKGMKTVLKERGIDTSKMIADTMREQLRQFPASDST